jgi:hypothetical protein
MAFHGETLPSKVKCRIAEIGADDDTVIAGNGVTIERHVAVLASRVGASAR